jgi:hypothetical protein
MAILMIPTVAFYAYGSVTAGTNERGSAHTDPSYWMATAVMVLMTGIPLAAIPTAGFKLIGQGRNWARVTLAVLLGAEGILCGCYGAIFPSLPFSSETRPSSPLVLYGIAVSTVVMALISIAVAVILFLPQSNAYFRAAAIYRAAKRRAGPGVTSV